LGIGVRRLGLLGRCILGADIKYGMQKLLDVFRGIGQLKPAEEKTFLSAIQKKEYLPKVLLQDHDKISDKIYFVEQGLARTYYYKDGKDVTYWLAPEGEFVGSMGSFFMREPSNKIVETLEPCMLWEFEYFTLEKLFLSSNEFARIGRQFAYYGISLMEKRLDSLHFNSAKERYLILINERPEILQRVSLGIIASYLGVTQETLSRIRKPF
jgi:CRP-like cAMP-binding protein